MNVNHVYSWLRGNPFKRWEFSHKDSDCHVSIASAYAVFYKDKEKLLVRVHTNVLKAKLNDEKEKDFTSSDDLLNWVTRIDPKNEWSPTKVNVEVKEPIQTLSRIALEGRGYVKEICLGHLPVSNGFLVCNKEGKPIEAHDFFLERGFNDFVYLTISCYDPVLYSITRGGLVLGKMGEWVYQPFPSNRDDDFIEKYRWTDPDEAINFYLETRKDLLRGIE